MEDGPANVPSDADVVDDGASQEPADELADLTAALEQADELPLDDRLELLRRAESAISRSLEGLDGL